LTVYLFRDSHFAPAGDTVVCAVEKTAVEAIVGMERFQTLFKGSAIYRNNGDKKDCLGVWGKQNASRLRRLLKENGAELIICRVPPPESRLQIWGTC
jgi:hypothetical protein